MRAAFPEQLQEFLETDELVIIVDRSDDVSLKIGQMMKMGLREVLDKHVPRYFQQRDLSWGWTTVIWLAYIHRCGDHRKVSVRSYIECMQKTLSQVLVPKIEPLDFTDGSDGCLLKYLSKPKYWHEIEKELNEKTIKIYRLEGN